MPADSAGLFSYIFYTWITPYILKAYKKGITIQDIPRISSYESCKYNTQRSVCYINVSGNRKLQFKLQFY